MPGTEFMMDVDLVLLALGFTGPVKQGMVEQFGVNLDARGNIATRANYMSSVPGVFAAGDMRRGQSLVVWAICGRPQRREGDRRISDHTIKSRPPLAAIIWLPLSRLPVIDHPEVA